MPCDVIVAVPSFIADILRKFDNMVEVILPQLPTSFSRISDPEGKGALIWILGEYGEARGRGKRRAGGGRGEEEGREESGGGRGGREGKEGRRGEGKEGRREVDDTAERGQW